MTRTQLALILAGALLLTACGGRGTAPPAAQPAPPAGVGAPARSAGPGPAGAPATAPASEPAVVVTTPVVGGAVKGGTYSGKVQLGYSFSFKLAADGRQITDVKADVLEKCGSDASRRTTVLIPGPVAVGADGSFAQEGKDENSYTYKFTGSYDAAAGAYNGTILQKGVTAGATCTTYELKWSAQRQ